MSIQTARLETAARHGTAHHQTRCASGRDGPESDKRLYTTAITATDPTRADGFTPLQTERFNKFLAELETPGYQPSGEPGIRST
jgi:hypothetical protein